MEGQGASERSENKTRNEEKTEEQSGREVWKQLVEEDDVPQTDGVWSVLVNVWSMLVNVWSMSSSLCPQRGFGFSEGSDQEGEVETAALGPSMGIYLFL